MCVRQRGQLSEELGYNLPCSPLTHKSNQPQAQNSSCSLPVAAPPPLIIPLFLAWRFLDQKKNWLSWYNGSCIGIAAEWEGGRDSHLLSRNA